MIEMGATRDYAVPNGLPRVKQRWLDERIDYLANGHRHVLTITSVGKTVTGWQCRLVRHEVDADGNVVVEVGHGIMFVDHLFEWCKPLD